MQIANPIYDVVFKYLLNDSKIAKLLLSSIIGEEKNKTIEENRKTSKKRNASSPN